MMEHRKRGTDTGTLRHCYSVLLSWGSSGEANMHIYCCRCSVTKSCLTLCDPMDCSMPDSSVFSTVSWRLLKFMSFELMMLSNHLILCCSPPFAFNLSQPQGLFNEYSGLISFRFDRLDILAVQGTLKSLLQDHSLKASILWYICM